ncbi:unnamed protein product [Malus baccata var. baccata]
MVLTILGQQCPSFHQKIWEVNIQLSAGHTDARACQESFEFVDDGPIKTEVSNRVEDLIKLAGIALELLVKVEKGTIWKTNVQLTAACTNAQTCQESFDIVKDWPFKTEVSNRVDDLSKLAGNALSLLVKIG